MPQVHSVPTMVHLSLKAYYPLTDGLSGMSHPLDSMSTPHLVVLVAHGMEVSQQSSHDSPCF